MPYHRGTIIEFNYWHEDAKLAEEITLAGKVGYIKGVEAPENQRTTSYSKAIEHPINNDDYIWDYGNHPDPEKELLSLEQVKELGWFE